MMQGRQLLSGVIEGFYGPLWSHAQRIELFNQMAAWGLNTFMYGPKDDLKHRVVWREAYTSEESAALRKMIEACLTRGLRFIYALSPGLDIRFSDFAELELLLAKIRQLESLGCSDFALLFDDIPDVMLDQDRARFGSFAAAQCWVANSIYRDVQIRHPQARFLFCPTPYCGRMALRQLGGPQYLETVGLELDPAIDVFWTGPEIISQIITPEHLDSVAGQLRRKPIIWDNLHANDYDGRRWFCGPYAGRPLEMKASAAGVLLNPNCEFPLNYVPVRTLASYIQCESAWEPRAVWLDAMREWWPRFASPAGSITLDDLIQFGDCYYLPHEEGPEAESLIRAVRELFESSPTDWASRVATFERIGKPLRRTCAEVANLYDRTLFAALSRRTWDLREELDLLFACIACRTKSATAPLQSDFHLPKTYRGGLVSRLQRMLTQHDDETFTINLPTEHHSESQAL